MTAESSREALLRELAQLIHERAGIDKRISARERSLKELTRSELENASVQLPYLNGRISAHAKKILEERGAIPRSELVEILQKGGAGVLNKNQRKEIDKALERCLSIGTIRETSTGLANAAPAKPVKKPSLFQKKKK